MKLKLLLLFALKSKARYRQVLIFSKFYRQRFSSSLPRHQFLKRFGTDQDWNLHIFQKTWAEALAEVQARVSE